MDTNLLTTLLFVGFIVVLMLFVNGVLLFNIFSARRKASAMQTWPSAPGSIVESELRSRRRGNRRIYYPHIVYQYNVMGQTYTGKRISPGPESGSSRARELVAKYPPGAPVTVYYDPQNPSDAALERDFSKTMPRLWFSLIAANIMLCLGMALPLLMFVFSNG
jgi:hypothetical protein